jgi:hypothetical protein
MDSRDISTGSDAAIRTALIAYLNQHDPGHRVINELALRHGRARIDVAAIGTCDIHGFEIKSASDSLRRLAVQVPLYDSVLDTTTIVCAERHLERAVQIVPQRWGLVVATEQSGAPQLQRLKTAEANPLQEPINVARLLWREEALALLTELGQDRGAASRPRQYIYERLADVAESTWIKARVCEQLKRRENWRPAWP